MIDGHAGFEGPVKVLHRFLGLRKAEFLFFCGEFTPQLWWRQKLNDRADGNKYGDHGNSGKKLQSEITEHGGLRFQEFAS
ncbi:MAG TPA: hypothetical protein EYN79_07565 [Planctomycetes bacterium]|nr:hypothetical protein [Planctomycetota bacterium]